MLTWWLPGCKSLLLYSLKAMNNDGGGVHYMASLAILGKCLEHLLRYISPILSRMSWFDW